MRWIFLIGLVPSLLSQPLPSSISLAWDAPTNVVGIIAYELQWGSSFTLLGTNVTKYTISGFPLSTNARVNLIRHASSGWQSDTNFLQLFHVKSVLEVLQGTNWVSVATNYFTREITNNALFRVRLEGTR